LDVDNDSEFLTWLLWRYFLDRSLPLDLRRSRTYKKNDQAHVDQRNFTHVRQLLGYERSESAQMVKLINQLYETWGLLQNFFYPTLKLESKTQVGSRTVRKHSKAQTPSQRLLASPHVSAQQKAQLSTRMAELNPIQLKSKLQEQFKTLLNQRRNRSAQL
jgi:hypothetical protein